jgi:hypothetical protein
MSTPPELDKRKTVRYTRRIPVRFGNEGKMIGGIALDISEGGLRLETSESFPVNSLVTVFVQFPGHALRLEGRIAWVKQSEAQIGIAFSANSLPLKKSYEAWLKEVQELAVEEGVEQPAEGPAAAAPPPPGRPDGTPGSSAAQPAPPSTAPNRPSPPTGPVCKRIETASGQAYEVVIEQIAESWYLTIHQIPRQPGVDAPDLQKVFNNYDAANAALREFIRGR